jgi:signal transduction histidine kinase
MKSFAGIIWVTLFLLLIVSGSCTKDCDCNEDPTVGVISEFDLNKEIIQVVTSNFATGFETIFKDSTKMTINDSAAHALQCQYIINPVRFLSDESGYFFVETDRAWMVAHAVMPELIGTYRYNSEDVNGKFYVRDMVETIRYKGEGFLDYYFEYPGTGQNEKKTAFVKAIPSAEFFIGTGFYDYQLDNYFTSEEAALFVVENATKSMAEGLSGGLEMMIDSMPGVMFCRQFIDHIRFFDNNSGYFFIYNFNCVNVAHGTQKDLQGQNLYNYQDSKGNYVIRGLVDIAKTTGSGYYDYYWNNPVTGQEEPKKAFVYKLPGIDYFIGSGVYFD